MLVYDHLPIVQPELQPCRVDFAAHGQGPVSPLEKFFRLMRKLPLELHQ